jgi:hypothetical protein
MTRLYIAACVLAGFGLGLGSSAVQAGPPSGPRAEELATFAACVSREQEKVSDPSVNRLNFAIAVCQAKNN